MHLYSPLYLFKVALPFGLNPEQNQYALAIHYIRLLVVVGLPLAAFAYVGDAYTRAAHEKENSRGFRVNKKNCLTESNCCWYCC